MRRFLLAFAAVALILGIAAPAVLAASLVFGGATSQGLIFEAIPELMSLPLLALALLRVLCLERAIFF